ncbi:site-specific integrase [Cupriavidus sp. MP-37]|uniref:site-specific integrase n=1 Tax=Cupriavidus sp. MP-37 TaxID=2884455 RepID=UPI001D0A9DE6|nr:site-specific integrase [Cupriavidus sp. MP-37]UDM51961.1 tyrosine-type recombinase/integrase [Cupriavidus sp. MP-37]
MQGLAPRAVWERYLPSDAEDARAASCPPGTLSGSDATRGVPRLTGWIRAELCAAAARGGDFAQARLLRLDLAPSAQAAPPSLEAFADREGLAECSEAEQLAAYEVVFGSALSQQRRRIRLLHRQLDAIYALETRMVQPPQRADGVEAWFVDSLALRLRAGGISSLGALHARMASRSAWWEGLRGVGAIKAQALEEFVTAHAASLGPLPLRTTPLPAPLAPAAAVREAVSEASISPFLPLAQLALSSELSGATGRFRAPPEHCLLSATDDRAAIDAWVAARGSRASSGATVDGVGLGIGQRRHRTPTEHAYGKEAERLLLWAVLVRRRALSSLTVEDCVAYREFLLAPLPEWCGPHGPPRWSSRWRPFVGALSVPSCNFALSVLGNLFGFLVDQGYLVGNPWRAVAPPSRPASGPDVGRAFTPDQWALIEQELGRRPPGLATHRLQIALPLLHDTGLRLSELIGATTEDLHWESWTAPGASRMEGWWLTVHGKRAKVREVPVPDTWVAALSAYLVARGYVGSLPQSSAVPLLGGASPRHAAQGDGNDTVSGNAFHRQLKRFFAHCAAALEADEPAAARHLRRASAHWLRHTHISHALEAGVPIEVVQQNVGHASLDTTTRYVHTEKVRRHVLMRKLWTRPT